MTRLSIDEAEAIVRGQLAEQGVAVTLDADRLERTARTLTVDAVAPASAKDAA